MTYDQWKTRSPDDEPFWGNRDHRCEKCDGSRDVNENEYGEFICDDCEQNAAEAAYDRHQEYLMENGSGPSLLEQQIEARKFK